MSELTTIERMMLKRVYKFKRVSKFRKLIKSITKLIFGINI